MTAHTHLAEPSGNQQRPTRVSPALRGDDAFARWFDGSKIVDGQGNPLVVYHGTKASFSQFLTPAWFTPSQEMADGFSAELGDGVRTSDSKVIPVYLSIKNPVCTSDWTVTEPNGEMLRQFQQWEQDGHDGIIFTSEDGEVEYIAFRPEQIKSAFENNGQFDARRPDIRYSIGEHEGSRAFRQWFRGSVATESGRPGGSPLVVYHGTSARFTAFDPARQGQTAGVGGGFFFTSSKKVAKQVYGWREGGRVMAVYLSLKKPLGYDQYFRLSGKNKFVETKEGRDAPVNYFDDHADEIVAFAQARGFDGIMWPADPDSELAHDLLVAFRPEQIKSATANTGRFDAASPDIRFSKEASEFDRDASFAPAADGAAGALRPLQPAAGSQGRAQEGTRQFKRWFGRSKAVDGHGRPLVMFHSTFADFSVFEQTRDIGFHFGSAFVANKRVDESTSGRGRGDGRVSGLNLRAVYLAIKNPLHLAEDPVAWMPNYLLTLIGGALPLAERARIAAMGRETLASAQAEAAELIKAGGRGLRRSRNAFGDVFVDVQNVLWAEMLARHQRPVYGAIREALKAAGYDGLTYANVVEGEGRTRRVRAANPANLTWVAFDAEQIKSAISNRGTFDAASPDIRCSEVPHGDAAESDDAAFIGYLAAGGNFECYPESVARAADYHHSYVVKDLAAYDAEGSLTFVRMGGRQEVSISGTPAMDPYAPGSAEMVSELARRVIAAGGAPDMPLIVQDRGFSRVDAPYQGRPIGTLREWAQRCSERAAAAQPARERQR